MSERCRTCSSEVEVVLGSDLSSHNVRISDIVICNESREQMAEHTETRRSAVES